MPRKRSPKDILDVIGKLKGPLLLVGIALYLITNLAVQILDQFLAVEKLSPEHFALIRFVFIGSSASLLILAVLAFGAHALSLWLENRTTLTLQEGHILTLHLQRKEVANIAKDLGKKVKTVKSELLAMLRKIRLTTRG